MFQSSPSRSTLVEVKVMVGNFSASKKSPERRWPSRSSERVSMLAVWMVTLTDERMTRYFMSIHEAAELIVQAGALSDGGEIFLLEMGNPVKIRDLAENMIRLAGLTVQSPDNPHGDIAIEFSGLRPGEKLYEELLIGDEVGATEHPMIMKANEEMLPWEAFKTVLVSLLKAVERGDYAQVRMLLRETVNGYCPDGDIVDLVHQQRRMEP